MTGDLNRRRLLAVAALFFTTGATGLIYEVLWTRQLIYIFGATIYAVSTVLAAFMAGLALGSWFFGRWSDSWRRPLRVYGGLEILIGLTAFAFPFLLGALDPIFQAMYDNLQTNFLLFSLIRFSLVFLLLLIPTTLMGATLPVLSRYLTRRSDLVGRRIGMLYACNTFGAVTGCFVAGFFLIEFLGLTGSTVLAVALNCFVGVMAIWLGRDVIGVDAPEEATELKAKDDAQYPPWVVPAVLASYGLSGAIALSYQVIWSRALVFAMVFMKNTTYAFTAMLTVFLIGLALGSAVMTRFVDKQRDPLRLYGLIQVLIGLGGALSFFMILRWAPGVTFLNATGEEGRILWIKAVTNTFLKTGAGIFAPTLMMGAAFPVAARLCVGGVRRIGGEVGRLYAVNTIGAIIGSFLGGFVIIPVLGMGPGLMILALLNVAIGVGLLCANPLSNRASRVLYGAVGLAALVLIVIRFPERHEPLQIVEDYEEMTFYEEGPLATVSVIRNKMMRHSTIFVDNVGVAGTDPVLLTDQKSLAHVPVLFLDDPKSALTVGFGSGGASHSYSLYDFMERVDCAEICPTVLKAAPYLTTSNFGIITPDPDRLGRYEVREDARGRYKVVLDDARSYLRFTRLRYDVIATDCTDLDYKSSANLYDLEYFQLCADRITEDGMVVVWMPLGGLSDEAFRVVLRTFYRVFPDHMSVWYMNNEPTHYVLLLGTPKPLKIDVEQMKARLADPRISGDLALIGLDSAEKLLSSFVVDERGLDAFLGESELLNTGDRPYLEFEAPRYGHGERPMFDNLDHLWEIRTDDLSDYLTNWKGATDPVEADLLKRYFAAADLLLKGHLAYRGLDVEGATRAYMKAAEICPEDPSIPRLLEFREMLFRTTNSPNDIWGLTMFGRALMLQGRDAEALDRFNSVARIPPPQSSDDESPRSRDLRVLAAKWRNECGVRLSSE